MNSIGIIILFAVGFLFSIWGLFILKRSRELNRLTMKLNDEVGEHLRRVKKNFKIKEEGEKDG